MTAMVWFEAFKTRWARLLARHPWVRWAQHWGISIGSLVIGVGTLLVFRRGIEYFPLFVGYLLLLWLTGVVFAKARSALSTRGSRVVWTVVDYTIQSMFHGLLLFLLPIYYTSTTLTSGNVWFLILLVAAALLTTIDPWYRAILLRFRWLEIVLFGFGLFASLNVAFPLLGVRSVWALILSGIVCMLALTPAFRKVSDASWRKAILRAGALAVIVAGLLWPLRRWIPPVPLHLTRATFARAVIRLEPEQPIFRISTDEVRSWGRVASFAAVVAPAGLREQVYHVWRKDGTIVGRFLISPISGGRPGGFRTYSWKSDLGPNPTGSWTVEVLTSYDQLIGRVRLRVTP